MGNHNTAEYWEYDTRLGRRWNIDPVDQISISNYAVNGNNPIWLNDPDGDSAKCPDPKTAQEGDIIKSGQEGLMDFVLMDGVWTGIGNDLEQVDIVADWDEDFEFSSPIAKAEYHPNEYMSNNLIGRISGPESSWRDVDGFKNKGWPTMKKTWGVVSSVLATPVVFSDVIIARRAIRFALK